MEDQLQDVLLLLRTHLGMFLKMAKHQEPLSIIHKRLNANKFVGIVYCLSIELFQVHLYVYLFLSIPRIPMNEYKTLSILIKEYRNIFISMHKSTKQSRNNTLQCKSTKASSIQLNFVLHFILCLSTVSLNFVHTYILTFGERWHNLMQHRTMKSIERKKM